MTFPKHSKYIIIGAGIHGLSTAFHLASELKARKLGDATDIIVLDKDAIASGASGIACGVVRNNYYQPAMREIVAHSVEVWESDVETYCYHPVGYMQISYENMREDICSIYEQQRTIGYDSTLIEGTKDSDNYMKNLFNDWQAKNITSVLHEKKGGYANNKQSVYGLARKAKDLGVKIITNTKVIGFKRANGATSAIQSVETDKGSITCDYLVIGAGPWIRDFWNMLELPKKISIRDQDGMMHDKINMWTYWQLEEGVLKVDPSMLTKNNGKTPPVIHIDTDAPLYSVVDGSLLATSAWGIYYKPDIHFGGVQGGAMPYPVDVKTDEVAIDPYGPASPEFIASPDFATMWCSALAHCHKRFEGQINNFDTSPSGGIGCFTPDNFPIIDVFYENCHIIADSNHGYKMLGIGKLVAKEILGSKSTLLAPFSFSRYKTGKLHPASNSPFPWS